MLCKDYCDGLRQYHFILALSPLPLAAFVNIFFCIFKVYSRVQVQSFFSYSNFIAKLQLHINIAAVMYFQLSCHKV
jgi:hypothetical protein